MDDERNRLEQAIHALEAQRGLLGDAVVETALDPLREKLASLQSTALPPQPMPEQRKLVSVLFADLVGFTPLAGKMDPEDVRDILDGYFTRWTNCIERHGGRVEKFIGDAVMAVYGLGQAHEDDPENAIYAAFEMKGELELYNQDLQKRYGIHLEMRVGVHTGPAVVSMMGERKGQDFVVVGDTVNLASRLQSAAPAGGVLISHDTYRHVRGLFEVQPLEPVNLKGVGQPVRAYQALRIRQRAFRLERGGPDEIESPLVGRKAELEALQNAFLEAQESRSLRWVDLVGEAGLGKSRLVDELDDWLELRPERIYYFRGRSSPAMQNMPYSLLRDLFALRFNILESDPAEAAREKWERGLLEHLAGPPHGSELTEGGRMLGELLGFEPCSGPCREARQLRDLSLAFLGEYFRSLTARYPLVVLLEDLHWADNSSLEMLARLEDAWRDQPVLVVAAARPELYERLPEWGQERQHRRMDLLPLAGGESQELIEGLLSRVKELPEALVDLVKRSAEGNPFYIEEFIQMLLEDGIIVHGEPNWTVETGRLAQVRVPPTLAEVLQARFDSLPLNERLTLQRASVIGRVFWDQAVAAMGDDLPVDAAGETYEDLRRREMIYPQRSSAFEEAHEYQFKHALLRDVTYESLLKRLRRIYHSHAAHWLEEVTQRSNRSDEFAALIAGHYDQGGEQEKALEWHCRAGELAALHFANTEALHSYQRAQELLPVEDRLRRWQILLAMDKIFDRTGKRESQQRSLAEMSALAEALEDGSQEATLRRAEIEKRKAVFSEHTGDYQAAAEHSAKTVDLARESRSPEIEADGLIVWASARWHLGEPQEAILLFDQALEISRREGNQEQEASCLRGLGFANDTLGDYAAARKYFEQSLSLYQEIHDLIGESMALNSLGVIAYLQGEYAQALQQIENALQIKRRLGDRLGESIGLGNLGTVTLSQGDLRAARQYFQQTVDLSREILDREGEAAAITGLGQAASMAGHFEAAREYLDQAIQISREIGDQSNVCSVLEILSRNAHGQGNDRLALEYTNDWLKIAQEGGFRMLEGQALFAKGYALLGLGDLEAAEQAFKQSLEIRQELELPGRVIESKGGLVNLALTKGELAGARQDVEDILRDLNLDGSQGKNAAPVDELEGPLLLYMTCYHYLSATGDRRAGLVLEHAYSRLQERAAYLDPEDRASYMENIPLHRELVAACQAALERQKEG